MDKNELKKSYEPKAFRRDAHAVVDLLVDYLQRSQGAEKGRVLPAFSPEKMTGRWDKAIPAEPSDDLVSLLTRVIGEPRRLARRRHAAISAAETIDHRVRLRRGSRRSAVASSEPATIEASGGRWMVTITK